MDDDFLDKNTANFIILLIGTIILAAAIIIAVLVFTSRERSSSSDLYETQRDFAIEIIKNLDQEYSRPIVYVESAYLDVDSGLYFVVFLDAKENKQTRRIDLNTTEIFMLDPEYE